VYSRDFLISINDFPTVWTSIRVYTPTNNMKKLRLFFAAACMATVAGCTFPDDTYGIQIRTFTFDFDEDDHGWKPGFSDMPAGPDDSVFYELRAGYVLAPSAALGHHAWMLSGSNKSDDLFMYLKRRVTGLLPNASYTVNVEVEFLSNAEVGQVGIGGAPAESVFLKAGAASLEPKSLIEEDALVMNIDKGNQSQGGVNMNVLGHIGVPPGTNGYAEVVRSNYSAANSPVVVRTNSQGELWLIVGTDSGFEGTTTLYYKTITTTFSRTDF